MKILSETIENGRVIELTREEWWEFQKLAQAVEGKTVEEMHHLRVMTDNRPYIQDAIIDLRGVFGAIEAFYRAKFSLTEMQRLIDLLKQSVEGAPKL